MPHSFHPSAVILLMAGPAACSRTDTSAAAKIYQNADKQRAEIGLTLVDVARVGDEAYGSTDSPESHGVKAQRGRYIGQVNLRMIGTTPLSRGFAHTAALVLLGVIITGCSGAAEQQRAVSAATAGAGTDTSQPVFAQMAGVRPAAPDSAAAAARRRQFDLCRILPLDTVARALRSTIGKSVSTTTTRPGGMCTYSDAANASPSVRVLVDIGRERSPAMASVSFLGAREQLGTHGTPTTDVPGVGDAAFGSSDSTGRYTVSMQQGALTGRVSVNVKGASASSLRPAAVELAKRTLAALH